MSAEVGQRLKASDLKRGTIVVIGPPDREELITMWVQSTREDLVVFFSGIHNWSVVNFVRDDGELIDDRGRVVRVFEYLGEP